MSILKQLDHTSYPSLKEGYFLSYYFKFHSDRKDYVSQYLLDFKKGVEPITCSWLEIAINNFPGHINYDLILRVLSSNETQLPGNNPLDKLGIGISEMKGCQYIPKCLYKVRETMPLASLNKVEREKVINNVYRFIPPLTGIKNILLLDNNITTGTTLNEIKRAIQNEIGSFNLYLFVLGKTYDEWKDTHPDNSLIQRSLDDNRLNIENLLNKNKDLKISEVDIKGYGNYGAAPLEDAKAICYAKTFYESGVEKFRSNDNRGAILDFSNAIIIYPNYGDAYYKRGEAKIGINNKESVDDFTKALKINPNNFEIYSLKALIKRHHKDYLGAISDFTKLIESGKNLKSAYFERGKIKAETGDIKGAMADFTQLISLLPNMREETSYSSNNNGISYDKYFPYVSLKHINSDVYVHRGNLKDILSDYQGALEDYNSALTIYTNNEEALLRRGVIKNKLGDYEGALSDSSKVLDSKYDLNNFRAIALSNCAKAKSNLGHYQDAISDYKKVIEYNPNDADAYYDRWLVNEKTVNRVKGAISHIMRERKIRINTLMYNDPIKKEPTFYRNEITRLTIDIKSVPYSYDLYNDRGYAKYELAGPEEAIVDYDEAINYNCNNHDAYFNRGIANFKLRKYKEAIGDFTKSIELKPNYSFSYINRANAKKRNDDSQGAIADFSKAIEIDPKFMEAYFNRGIVNEILGDTQGAMSDYTKAIELNPNYLDSYFMRAILKQKSGDFCGEISDYTIVIEKDAKNKFAYTYREDAKEKLGDYPGTISEISSAIEILPDNYKLLKHRALLKQKLGDINGEILDYNKAIEINSSYDSFFKRGNAKQRLGDFQGAILDYAKAIEIGTKKFEEDKMRGSPKTLLHTLYFELFKKAGLFHSELGLFREAISDYSKAIEINPDDNELFLKRGYANLKEGFFPSAVSDFTKVLEQNPNHTFAYEQRAFLKYKQGDLKGALTDYAKIIQLDPNLKNLYYRSGVIKHKLKDLNGALHDYSRAIQINPKHANSYYKRGFVNLKLGKFERSKSDFKYATELDPKLIIPSKVKLFLLKILINLKNWTI